MRSTAHRDDTSTSSACYTAFNVPNIIRRYPCIPMVLKASPFSALCLICNHHHHHHRRVTEYLVILACLWFLQILTKLLPCVIITPLDCFWEGSKLMGPENGVYVPWVFHCAMSAGTESSLLTLWKVRRIQQNKLMKIKLVMTVMGVFFFGGGLPFESSLEA